MTKLIILGTGGNCLDIVEAVTAINLARGERVYECLGFLDDDLRESGKKYLDLPVLGPLESAKEHSECCFVNGIGSPSNFRDKRNIIARTGVPLERFETLIHPSAVVARSATLGQGTVILQNASVCSNAKIGDHVLVLPGSVISHDDAIGDYCSIASGVCISGSVSIGESCYLGANSSIIGGVSIGSRCLVGMGSVVIESVVSESVIVGNPGRLLRKAQE